MPMPMADNRRRRVIRRRQLQSAPVARPRQRRIEFFFAHRLDETAHCHAQACRDRIKPIVEKLLIGDIARRLRGICFHGVISIGAQTPIRFVETMRRLRYLQIPTTSATAPMNGAYATVVNRSAGRVSTQCTKAELLN
jgi:hypothetical protein